MDLGLLVFPHEGSMKPGALAAAAEDRGFESIWFPEHSHLPLASSRWPGGPVIPDAYAKTMDQFVCMTAAACATEIIKVGSGICIVPQHHPAWLAKQVATLDHLSNGRVILGIGFGWNPAELGDHGVEYSARRDVTREVIEAMQALWSQDVASYEGEHVSISPSRALPKPIQQPHPPIVIGAGAGPKLYSAVASYADGWGPMNGRDEIVEHLGPLRSAVAAAGRDADALDITVFNGPRDAASLTELDNLGVTRVVLGVPTEGEDRVLPIMDRYAELL
ncbi:MAG: LLM class F420-dependent oxidoreductase [Actinomycetota bacterium]|jgi:probable F420-dependent oxidoreductase|nr:LLM class F420-dependent oxidoreductase [Actinomycetota bacterium]